MKENYKKCMLIIVTSLIKMNSSRGEKKNF